VSQDRIFYVDNVRASIIRIELYGNIYYWISILNISPKSRSCSMSVTGDAKESDQLMAGASTEADRQMALYEVRMIHCRLA
jgi:hypothetical protein